MSTAPSATRRIQIRPTLALIAGMLFLWMIVLPFNAERKLWYYRDPSKVRSTYAITDMRIQACHRDNLTKNVVKGAVLAEG